MSKESKEAGELPQCENCGEYSRARADQQTENDEKWQHFINFVARRKKDVAHIMKEYTGSGQSKDAKFMAGIYRSEIRSYDDLLNWAEFFLEVKPDESDKKAIL